MKRAIGSMETFFTLFIFLLFPGLQYVMARRAPDAGFYIAFSLWMIGSAIIFAWRMRGRKDERNARRLLRDLEKGNIERHESLKSAGIDWANAVYEVIHYLYEQFIHIKVQLGKTRQAAGVVKSNFEESVEGIRQISRASGAIAQGAENQARDAEKTLSFTRALDQKIAALTEVTHLLSAEADAASAISRAGEKHVNQLTESDKESQSLIAGMSDRIAGLNSITESIGQITSTISEISDQTNLLSLNASIEAARAGEAGRGFAVVADEVRKLAEQSRRASTDISRMIGSIQAAIRDFIAMSEDTRKYFNNRTGLIEAVNTSFKEIQASLAGIVKKESSVNGEVEALGRFKDEVIAAVSDIATIAEETAAGTEEVASLVMYQESQQDTVLTSMDDIQASIGRLEAILQTIHTARIETRSLTLGISLLEKSEFLRTVEEGAAREARKRGIGLLSGTPDRFDVDRQIERIEWLLSQGIQGLAVFPGNEEKMLAVINRVSDRGIPVVCIDNDMPKSRRATRIGNDYLKLGRMAGESAARLLGNKGKVIALLCASTVENVQWRFEGFKSGLGRQKEIQILEKVDMPGTDIGETTRTIEDLIRRHPDFDLLYVVTDESSIAAARVFKQKGLKKKLVCIANSVEVMKHVKEGIVSAQFCMRNGLWGARAVKYLVDIIEGRKVPASDDTGYYRVTKTNVHVFLKE